MLNFYNANNVYGSNVKNQGRSELLMNGGVQLKNFRIAWNIFRTKFFTIYSIVSDVAIMQRVSRRVNTWSW